MSLLLTFSPVGSPTIPLTDATMPAPSLAAAAGHGKLIVLQSDGEERLENLFGCTANARDDLDSAGGQQGFQRERDGPANQRLDPQGLQSLDAAFGCLVGECFLATGVFHRAVQFNDQQLSCHIEDRRDPALPDWNCDNHGLGTEHATCQRWPGNWESSPTLYPYSAYAARLAGR